jgi:hypothetical protein
MNPSTAVSEPSAPVPQSGVATARAALRARLHGTNINEKTLLATDYLNHFSEFVMLLDLIPDMPECLDDATAWTPKGYREHFRDSGLSSRELAIEAYDAAPPEFRDQFDSTAATIHALVPRVLDRIRDAARAGRTEGLAHECASTSTLLKGLMDAMSAIVNGEKTTIDQAGVDALLRG